MDMEVTGYRTETMEVNDKGQLNLVDMWAARDHKDEYDPQTFFNDVGTGRFVKYLEAELEEPCLRIDHDEQSLWVHPLLMYKYLAWCEPQVMAMGMDLYHDFVKNRLSGQLEEVDEEAEAEHMTRH
nr:hypothetical protein [Endozoicomonas sp.]